MSVIIGYHGTANPQAAESLLARIAGPGHQPCLMLRRACGHKRINTIIAHAGSHTHATQGSDFLRVSMTASGLGQPADILIEAGDDYLKLGRDAFGRVTLYWLEQADGIWFSSRLQTLLPLLPGEPQVSPESLWSFACFSWMPAPLTPVAAIAAVPAGGERKFIFRPDGSVLQEGETFSVWQQACDAADEIRDEATAIAQLRALLEGAMTEQLRDLSSSEPVGVFLSGGLDSSITAALLARAGMRVRAYALDFGEYGLSELPYAESVAQHLRIPLVKVDASPRRIRRVLRETMRALDLPFGDGVTVPLYLLGEAAGREVGTVFNGEGGDQLFAGWTNKPLIAAGVYTGSQPESDDFERAYLRTFHRLHGHEATVFNQQFAAQVAGLRPLDLIGDALGNVSDTALLHRLRRAGLMLKGAQNIQPRATNLALAHALRLRTPFCHMPLAEWTFRVSGDLWLRGACEKYLLKRAVEAWLPEEVVWREKRGMGVPLTLWCLGPLWRELGRWLSPEALRAEGIFQPDLALRIATGRFSGNIRGRRIGELLWLLLAWQVWRQTVLHGGMVRAGDLRRTIANPFWLPSRLWQWKYQTMI